MCWKPQPCSYVSFICPHRTKMLCCESDEDFLAKVYCLRLAFDFLIQSSDHRAHFMSLSCDILSGFLRGSGEDPTNFIECFHDIVSFLERPKNQLIAEEELVKRKVDHGVFIMWCE